MAHYVGTITKLEENQVFVFGSNTQGRHGKGAALLAYKEFGAIYGQPRGFQGRSYAIITKDLTKQIHPSVSREVIIAQIRELYNIASKMPTIEFLIAYTAEPGLNGYRPTDMAEMFLEAGEAPKNIVFNYAFWTLMDYCKSLNTASS